jgi:hypothetical protein
VGPLDRCGWDPLRVVVGRGQENPSGFGQRGPEPNTAGERLTLDGLRELGPLPGLGAVREKEGKHGC